MKNHNLNKPIANRPFENEYKFVATDSALPGDQYTSKTETQVTLEFHVKNSRLLSEEEKEAILTKLKRRINDDGFLQVSAGEYNSQTQNKHLAEKRFYNYLVEALKRRKKVFLQDILKRKLKKGSIPKRKPSGQSGKRRKKLLGQKKLYKGPIH
ncbi:hypothetical protein ES705_20526 [subsurface metagenome]